jgi:hypothetical protein
MSITVARYTFNSWLRRGIGTRIAEVDHLGGGTSAVLERSTVPIDVVLNTEPLHKDFSLIGPGDIIGLLPSMVVRTEPLNRITSFEPNYLAFVEFYDEDFIWRYTPARANGLRLRPWLALLVAEEKPDPAQSEFEKNDRRVPLPSVTIRPAAALPPPDQAWAWGHVHINEGYDTPSQFEQFLLSLHNLNSPNADKIICRLMSPRKLRPNRAYRAFVVPAFETGRLAGLGRDPSAVDAQRPAWTAGASNVEFPIYYEWSFQTGENEDFESLVDLLQPNPMNPEVGIRDMDGTAPGFGATEGTDLGKIPPPPPGRSQTIVGLEGALKAPTTVSRPVTIDTTKPFFHALQAHLNRPAELQAATNGLSDPLIEPPIYGENHALRHTVDVTSSGWLNELNRDPRDRVPAGFGVRVVQANQEAYVARAWEQVKRILDLNRRVQLTVFAMSAVQAIQRNFVSRITPAETLALFAPVLKKVKGSPTTLHQQLTTSTIPSAAVDGALRRMIRPRGSYGKRLRRSDTGFSSSTLVNDLNEQRVSAAPPKPVPADLNTDDRLVSRLPVTTLPDWLRFLIRHRWLVLLFLLALAVVIGFFGSWTVAAGIAAAAVGFFIAATRWTHAADAAASLRDPNAVLADIKAAAPRPAFRLTLIDPLPLGPLPAGTQTTTTTRTSSSSPNAITLRMVTLFTPHPGGGESLEAANFRGAAARLSERLTIAAPERQVRRLDMANAHAKLSHAIDPGVAFPKLVAAGVGFSFDRDWLNVREHLVPAMAYPDFADPMYAKLRDISSELFLPNLQLIPPNTISLLETNDPFIESYMAGLNHEFGRELLWREYPTDRRGSYFRQFWDVKGIITDDATQSAEALAEQYKDIVPMDEWESMSTLGTHRPTTRPPGKRLVLVVRGELLKKYPNTIVYAHRAHIYRNRNGTPNPAHEPIIIEPQTEADMKAELRFPIFRAEVEPDLRFFGFELTIAQARGDENPQAPDDDWGWYFIIQQVPGEPRFGMDVRFSPDDEAATPITWDDLGWDAFPESLSFISTTNAPAPSFTNLITPALRDQWGRNSADMAFILYQKPVMIAIHAKEMLDKLDQPPS